MPNAASIPKTSLIYAVLTFNTAYSRVTNTIFMAKAGFAWC